MRDFGIKWLEPWEPVTDGEALEAELRRELHPEHLLFGEVLRVIGWSPINLDALVWFPEGATRPEEYFGSDAVDTVFASVHFGWRHQSFTDLIQKSGMLELVGVKKLVNVIAGTMCFDNVLQVQTIIDRDHQDWTQPQPPSIC
jgi:hypothetical protein